MKLKNFLGVPESAIEIYLKNCRFTYYRNYGWERIITVMHNNIYKVYICCNLNKYELKIRQIIHIKDNKDNSKYIDNIINTIEIPKELVEKDEPFKFMDWLDKVCEPYL